MDSSNVKEREGYFCGFKQLSSKKAYGGQCALFNKIL